MAWLAAGSLQERNDDGDDGDDGDDDKQQIGKRCTVLSCPVL